MKHTIYIDGENGILGRIAALAAKKALQGNAIAIVNAEKVAISGNRKNIIENYLQLRRRRNVKFPSNPEQIMKRTIRGMIDYKSGRGAVAFKNVKCYKGIPAEFSKEKFIKMEARDKDLMKLEELSKLLK
jgi:large subunit ribosomal protein L13